MVKLQIVAAEIGGHDVNAVNARDLWRVLKIQKRYADWIKYQIDSLDLQENLDYVVFHKNGKNPKGGRPSVEYVLTIDAAKHIAMASKTPAGKRVRQYFIEVEKEWRKNPPSYMITDPIKRAQRWIEEQKEKLALQKKIEQDRPKVEFATAIESSEGAISIGNYAKMLSKENGIKIGQNRLFAWLRKEGYLIKGGKRKNFPLQKYVDRGYFEVETKEISTEQGVQEVHITLITGKGQVALANKIVAHFSK